MAARRLSLAGVAGLAVVHGAGKLLARAFRSAGAQHQICFCSGETEASHQAREGAGGQEGAGSPPLHEQVCEQHGQRVI